MANNKTYKFNRGEEIYVIFDTNGYVVDAKGFSSLIWTSDINLDKNIIGLHVNELAEMLKKNSANRREYINFELNVHIELLKWMVQNLN